MYLVVIGWLYVAVMMAVAEATSPQGSVLGAMFTFLLYGIAPLAIVVYIMGTPARKKAMRRREEAQRQADQAASGQPDGGGKPPADPVAPVREEP